MEKLNFTLNDIQKTLHSHYKNFFWTGKIFDEKICDYKDLEIKDFNSRSMHSFLFVDKEDCFCERDVQISNTHFIIYNYDEYQTIEKDLSTKWQNLINKNENIL